MALPEVVLAFKVLACTGLEHKDRQLVLTGVDCKNTISNLSNQMKMSLKKFLENSPSQFSCGTRGVGPSINVEPTFVTENEEEAYYRNRRGYRTDRREYYNGSGRARGDGFSHGGRGCYGGGGGHGGNDRCGYGDRIGYGGSDQGAYGISYGRGGYGRGFHSGQSSEI